jgi:hypothetical protein
MCALAIVLRLCGKKAHAGTRHSTARSVSGALAILLQMQIQIQMRDCIRGQCQRAPGVASIVKDQLPYINVDRLCRWEITGGVVFLGLIKCSGGVVFS